ncbi:kinase-like domain-containing protein, partial [Cristinia sonorae]
RVALQQTFLEHPNISEFFGVSSLGIDAPTLAMISPWASNGNICDAIDAKRSSGELFRQLHDVALGMEHLHSLGIVHGALHGTNILISEEGRAQLTDIGMATIAQAVAHNLNLPGCGGNRWTAPELIDPEEFGLTSSEPTIFGDVYSFGFLCVELYSGGPAFYGLDEYQVGKRVVRGERPPRPTDPRMSDSLWSLVTICWGQNAHHRPEIATVVRTVAIILDEVVGYATPETRDSSLSEVSASFVTMSSDIAQEVGILVKNNANVVDDNFELIVCENRNVS